jgi:hypothetical protein
VGNDLVARIANASIEVLRHGPLEDLIPFHSAPAFVEAANSLGVRILGIEGFYLLSSNKVMPEMRAITDL